MSNKSQNIKLETDTADDFFLDSNVLPWSDCLVYIGNHTM